MLTPLRQFYEEYPILSIREANRFLTVLKKIYISFKDNKATPLEYKSISDLINELFTRSKKRRSISRKLASFPEKSLLYITYPHEIDILIEFQLIIQFSGFNITRLIITPEGLALLLMLNEFIKNETMESTIWSNKIEFFEPLIYYEYMKNSRHNIKSLDQLVSSELSRTHIIILLLILLSNPVSKNGLIIENPVDAGKLFDKIFNKLSKRKKSDSAVGLSRVLIYDLSHLNQRMNYLIDVKTESSKTIIKISNSNLKKILYRLSNSLSSQKGDLNHEKFWKNWEDLKKEYNHHLIELKALKATNYSKKWELSLEATLKNSLSGRLEM